MSDQVWHVLSLTQPWASAMFTVKRIETRSWRTNYRGRIYIHAAKGFPPSAQEFAKQESKLGRGFEFLPLGYIIGHVELVKVKCVEGLVSKLQLTELLYGDYSEGRFGWVTENPVLLAKPIQAKGKLGLWKYIPTEEDMKR